MYKLAPSILSADFNILGEQISQLEKAGSHYLHFDVMDGHFVPNISIGIPVLKSVRNNTDLVIDAHLMISNPERYIESFADAGADIITFHLEATDNPINIINLIKKCGKKVGLSIKPSTSIESVYEYIKYIDMILLMSVEPGFGGQLIIDSVLTKSKILRAYITRNNINIDIQMDGGIHLGNLDQVLDSGVNIVVAGSSIFDGGKIAENTNLFLEEINKRGK